MAAGALRRRIGISFSALQRAEIAEIDTHWYSVGQLRRVSVLFNEPKLLKFLIPRTSRGRGHGFSALQRAEIAEIVVGLRSCTSPPFGFSALQRAEIAEMTRGDAAGWLAAVFQCSSTSRNC